MISLNQNISDLVKGTDFSELCITSGAKVNFVNKDEIKVETTKSEGNKCPACWKITKESCSRSNCALNKS